MSWGLGWIPDHAVDMLQVLPRCAARLLLSGSALTQKCRLTLQRQAACAAQLADPMAKASPDMRCTSARNRTYLEQAGTVVHILLQGDRESHAWWRVPSAQLLYACLVR